MPSKIKLKSLYLDHGLKRSLKTVQIVATEHFKIISRDLFGKNCHNILRR